MKTTARIAAMLAVSLLPSTARAMWPDVSAGRLSGPSVYVDASGCKGVDGPCATTIQGGLDKLHALYPSSYNRVLRVASATYTEDVDCDPADGYTQIIGDSSKAQERSTDKLPTIVGATNVSTPGITLHTTRCGVTKIAIINGPDQDIGSCGDDTCTDRALVLDMDVDLLSVLFDQVYVAGDKTDGIGLAHLAEFNGGAITGTIFVENSKLYGAGTLGSTTGTTAAVAYVNNAAYRTFFTNTSITTLNLFATMTGTATLQVDDGYAFLQRVSLDCEGDASTGGNCTELERTDGNVIYSDVSLDDGFSAAGATAVNGRFMQVYGAGATTGTARFVTPIGGVLSLTLDSSWGTIVPAWDGGCINPFSVHLDADDTQDTYVSLFDGQSGTSATGFDDWINSYALMPVGFRVDRAAAVGAGETVAYTLRAGGSATLATCSLSGAGAGGSACVDSTPRSAVPRPPGNKWDIFIDMTAPPVTSDSGETIISGCLPPIPR